MEQHLENMDETTLANYFAGELSSDEISAVDQWRKNSQENEDQFRKYQMLWQDLGAIQFSETELLKVDVEEAWKNVSNKKKQRIPYQFQIFLKIAASVLLVLGLSWFVKNQVSADKLQLIATLEGTQSLNLSDGSAVTLNRNSSLEFPVSFEKKNRQVNLSGEAFFEVAHNPDSPFEIKIGKAKVTVLGTSFNIKSNKNADTVVVSVQTGKVRFVYEDQELILTAQQKGVLYTLNQQMFREEVENTGIDQFWRTRTLTYAGESLPNVLQSLEKAYGQKMKLANSKMEQCRLNARFENDSLDNILEVIALTFKLEIRKDDEMIILDGAGCDTQ